MALKVAHLDLSRTSRCAAAVAVLMSIALPVAATDALPIKARDGTYAVVPDFTAGMPRQTMPNGSFYYLVPQSDVVNRGYQIVYGTDSSIGIGLFKKPLASTRLAAERELRRYFPLPDKTLCRLNVQVTVLSAVDPALSGQNLGLSFCHGSARLQ